MPLSPPELFHLAKLQLAFILNEGLPLLAQVSWLRFGFTAWLASSAVDAGVARPSSPLWCGFSGVTPAGFRKTGGDSGH